ncbi:polysaccharide pyruvyl transferase family protein [Brevundimonas sp. TWP2-3-2]|uniref:polysaccharide pyruvyl transferase family protein n=1 Tax=unclassified Brevundimonas TaxID=2622653 RepID=UPI003CED1906
MTRNITIGLLWQTLDHPNLGVDALTRANIAILRAACARAGVTPEFVLLGTPGPRAPDLPGIRQGGSPGTRQMLLGRGSFFDDLNRCNIVFDTSEGDSFTDIYGWKRCLAQSGSKLIAMRGGRPLVLSPQTIGPFNKSWSRALARHVIGQARLTFARDHLSTEALHDLGVRDRIDEAIDVAFCLPFVRAERIAGDRIGVGVNVSGLMYRAAERFQMTIDYPGFVRALLVKLTARDDVEVWLVPHVLSEDGHVDDDAAINRLIHAEFSAAKLAPAFKSSVEAKSFISGLDVFTGARMHACIAAFSSGVPVVPIAYSRKFNGLFQSLKYSRFVDGRASTNESALAMIDTAIAERAQAAAEIVTAMEIANSKLARYEDALVPLIAEAAHG